MRNYIFITLLVLSSLPNEILFSQSLQATHTKKYWVIFKDKGDSTELSGSLSKGTDLYNLALSQLNERAVNRRLKVLPIDRLVDIADLPINQKYIESIKSIGGILQHEVRWMNAATFLLSPEQIIEVQKLQFVEKIKPVNRFVLKNPTIVQELHGQLIETVSDYGASYAQYSSVKIPEVHSLGITGKGVIVGMLDTGFRWRVHESLKNTEVIAERDFINNDDTTANQPGDPFGQDSHGTLTMSIIGSYMPGKIIGPAFKSSFILAKTEYIPTETQIEEDWWAAGIEWMENLGVDVVSSSLGYNIFDNGAGYTWDNGDFNGKTSVTAKAAARAARLGVVVATAMGNERNGDGIQGTILTPADADSILSVGAITIAGTLAYFSSTGPTNDGRVKPDIVAPGVSIYSAITPGPATYGYSQGTSASTPIVAGVAALILSARPELSPIQVRDAIRNTADRVEVNRFPTHPNNFVGWGRLNAWKAISYPSLHFVSGQSIIKSFLGFQNGVINDSVKFIFTTDTIEYNILPMLKDSLLPGRSIGTYKVNLPQLLIDTKVYFYITGKDSNQLTFRLPDDSTKMYSFVYGKNQIVLDSKKSFIIPKNYYLSQNYPNPFNSGTFIKFDSNRQIDGILEIYNLLGQRIYSFNRTFVAGTNFIYWDGRDDNGLKATSGAYIYRLRTSEYTYNRKMLLLR